MGLTDGKLKDELSILANVDIWNQAIVELRGEEKLLKQKLQELLITMKLQSTELLLTKQAQIRKAKTQLEEINEEIRSLDDQLKSIEEELFMKQYLQLRNTPTDWTRLLSTNDSFPGNNIISIADVQEELNLLQKQIHSMEKEKESFVQTKLEPLKSQYLQALAALNTNILASSSSSSLRNMTNPSKGKKTVSELEQEISQQEKLLTEIVSKINYLNASTLPLEKKLQEEIQPQIENLFLQAYERIRQGLNLSPTPPPSNLKRSDYPAIFTKHLYKALLQLLSVMEQFYFSSPHATSPNLSAAKSAAGYSKTPHSSSNATAPSIYNESSIQQRVHQLSSFYQKQQEEWKMKLSSIQEKIATIHASIHQYHRHDHAETYQNTTSTEKEKASITASHGMIKEICPTCHQPLPLAQIQEQLATLQEQLAPLVKEKEDITRALAANTSIYQLLQDIFIPLQQSLSLIHQEKSLTQQTLQDTKNQLQQLLHQQNAQVTPLLEALQREYTHAKQLQESQIHSFQQAYEHAENQMTQMQQRIQEYSNYAQQVQTLLQQVIQTMLPPIQTQKTIKTTQQVMLHDQIRTLEREYAASNELFQQYEQTKQVLNRDLLIVNQLMYIFGNRGIQHYLYATSLLQLEYFANQYLSTMTEQGGMILRLKSLLDANPSTEGMSSSATNAASSSSSSSSSTNAGMNTTITGIDKIMKSVYIRRQHTKPSFVPDEEFLRSSTAMGQDPLLHDYKERALSQLSGGQWRRVSFALDLAFTEVIKRRGLLRCNILVLDEILTHLDAQGREAVGSVLKALVEGSHELHRGQAVGKEAVIVDDEVVESKEEGGDPPRKLDGKDRILEKSNGHSFESIFIILQDLVANELEESFDSIDTVVKEGDSSRVEIDQH